jgi:tetratricopeptide (TPR) repeat protein
MPQLVTEFMRFSAPDPAALERDIAETRLKLATAVQAGDSLVIVEAAADLGSMLTIARMEVEAAKVLEEHILDAEAHAQHETAAWFWNAYATALQYCGRRNQAEPYFVKAIDLAKSGGWRRVEALALHHWGRSLAEQERYSEAESRISEAIAIRVELNEPRQESSRRALVQLSALQDNHGRQQLRSDA